MELQKIDLQKKETSRYSQNKVTEPQMTATKSTPTEKKNGTPQIGLFIFVLVLGLSSGYLLKKPGTGAATSYSKTSISREVPEAGLKEGDIVGVQDEKSFKDTTTGVLEKGGIDGEGSHKLIRPGGLSQNVYLTSSVIDLDAFVGHQVTVWGDTIKGQKAGWLMDVGRVRVEKLNAPTPE